MTKRDETTQPECPELRPSELIEEVTKLKEQGKSWEQIMVLLVNEWQPETIETVMRGLGIPEPRPKKPEDGSQPLDHGR